MKNNTSSNDVSFNNTFRKQQRKRHYFIFKQVYEAGELRASEVSCRCGWSRKADDSAAARELWQTHLVFDAGSTSK